MDDLCYNFGAGCLFGLAGGLTPGPTTTLVVSQTLRFGAGEGAKVAIAPALTDAPIIVLAVALVGQAARFEPLLGVITLSGAAFLVYLARDSFKVRGLDLEVTAAAPRSLRRGFLANLLNPHPWLFWLVIGAPTLLRAAGVGWLAAALFLAGLYGCLIGAKLLMALVVGRWRHALHTRSYVVLNRLLGAALVAFAVFFVRDALRCWGVR